MHCLQMVWAKGVITTRSIAWTRHMRQVEAVIVVPSDVTGSRPQLSQGEKVRARSTKLLDKECRVRGLSEQNRSWLSLIKPSINQLTGHFKYCPHVRTKAGNAWWSLWWTGSVPQLLNEELDHWSWGIWSFMDSVPQYFSIVWISWFILELLVCHKLRDP